MAAWLAKNQACMVAACSPDEIRPLTDYVISGDPEEVPYDIDLTYYLTRDGSISASEAQSGVNEAVQRYIRWQSGKMGRDINLTAAVSASFGRHQTCRPQAARLYSAGRRCAIP